MLRRRLEPADKVAWSQTARWATLGLHALPYGDPASGRESVMNGFGMIKVGIGEHLRLRHVPAPAGPVPRVLLNVGHAPSPWENSFAERFSGRAGPAQPLNSPVSRPVAMASDLIACSAFASGASAGSGSLFGSA